MKEKALALPARMLPFIEQNNVYKTINFEQTGQVSAASNATARTVL